MIKKQKIQITQSANSITVMKSSLIYEDDEKEVLCVAPPPMEIALIDLTREYKLLFN